MRRPGSEPDADIHIGDLIGRPDLDDVAVRAAVVERLNADGRETIDPDIVLDAARLGKRKALAFLRKLVLPPPVERLDMPVRPILRSQIRQAENR